MTSYAVDARTLASADSARTSGRSPFRGDNAYCNPTGMTVARDGGTFLGYTQCFDANGALVGTPYPYALWDR